MGRLDDVRGTFPLPDPGPNQNSLQLCWVRWGVETFSPTRSRLQKVQQMFIEVVFWAVQKYKKWVGLGQKRGDFFLSLPDPGPKGKHKFFAFWVGTR